MAQSFDVEIMIYDKRITGKRGGKEYWRMCVNSNGEAS